MQLTDLISEINSKIQANLLPGTTSELYGLASQRLKGLVTITVDAQTEEARTISDAADLNLFHLTTGSVMQKPEQKGRVMEYLEAHNVVLIGYTNKPAGLDFVKGVLLNFGKVKIQKIQTLPAEVNSQYLKLEKQPSTAGRYLWAISYQAVLKVSGLNCVTKL